MLCAINYNKQSRFLIKTQSILLCLIIILNVPYKKKLIMYHKISPLTTDYVDVYQGLKSITRNYCRL